MARRQRAVVGTSAATAVVAAPILAAGTAGDDGFNRKLGGTRISTACCSLLIGPE